jgi:hypothetical protein
MGRAVYMLSLATTAAAAYIKKCQVQISPGDQLSGLRLFVVFLSTTVKILG